nr:MAG TPA: hypothetical protein [Caudoviricetes sp.]
MARYSLYLTVTGLGFLSQIIRLWSYALLSCCNISIRSLIFLIPLAYYNNTHH